MSAEWGSISQELMSKGMLVTAGVKETLLSHPRPFEVLKQGEKIGFQRGMLTGSILDQMIAEYAKKKKILRLSSEYLTNASKFIKSCKSYKLSLIHI